MKIGIISDSHDAHRQVLKAVEIFNQKKVSYIFHAGDIVSPFTAKAFAEVQGAKFIAVFGNCDGEKLVLKQTIEAFGGEIHERTYTGQIEQKRIFMTHVPTMLDEVIDSGHYDIVIYGHTHKRDIRKIGSTLVINPGEATDWITGTSFVVILDLDALSCEVVSLI